MKNFILLCFLGFYKIGLFGQIPNATKQPKWVFPLYFEEGTGMRDTIYIGYDSASSVPVIKDDTIFGENWIVTDTSTFFAFIGIKYGNQQAPDTILKIQILPQLDVYFDIQFKNAKWPVTMKFDISLFYSDSLPYLDNAGVNGYAELPCYESDPDPTYHTCDMWVPLRLSDDPLNYFYETTDSVVFIGNNQSVYTPDNGLALPIIIKPYAPITFIKKNDINNSCFVYPNPFIDQITIENLGSGFSYSLRTIDGKEISTTHFNIKNSVSIKTDILPPGMYYLIIQSKNQKMVQKIIKL